MAEEFIRKISDRKGVRMLALFYLTDNSRFGTDVPLLDMADHFSVHPSSISNALDPLIEDSYFSTCLERKKFRNIVTYRINNTESGEAIKKFFDTARGTYNKS